MFQYLTEEKNHEQSSINRSNRYVLTNRGHHIDGFIFTLTEEITHETERHYRNRRRSTSLRRCGLCRHRVFVACCMRGIL
nr:MAG TPA: hypothetical protein [Caudoviricetes sp.]